MSRNSRNISELLPARVGTFCTCNAGTLSGRRVLVAVSGGSDSVALMHLLLALRETLGIELVVGHLNHALRGDESDADCQFVIDESKRIGLPCETFKQNILDHRQNGESVEMAARRLRYTFFRGAALRHGCDLVATGHTADDQAETLLMRLFRGASLRGMGGIRAYTEVMGVTALRPLLSETRGDLRNWLSAAGLVWREDSSNASADYQRNRLRNELIPLIKERINPAVCERLVSFSGYAREDDAALDSIARERFAEFAFRDDGSLSCLSFNEQPLAIRRRWVVLWLEQHAPTTSWRSAFVINSITDMAQGVGDAMLELEGGVRVRREGDLLRICTASEEAEQEIPDFSFIVGTEGCFSAEGCDLRVTTCVRPGIVKDATREPGRLPAEAALRLPETGESQALSIRNFREGDRMKPFGINGSRKLQDIFVDLHVPRKERGRIPLLLCGEEIIWLPGYRIASGWAVKSESDPALRVRIERACRT